MGRERAQGDRDKEMGRAEGMEMRRWGQRDRDKEMGRSQEGEHEGMGMKGYMGMVPGHRS